MSDQTVTWAAASTATLNPGTWTYNPIRYWPVNGTSWQRVSFFAYTPAQSTSTTITFVPAGAKNKNPKIHYVMPVALSSQADFIVDAKYNVTGYNNSEVKFNFDHVLSRIGFQAKLKEDYEDVIITITNLLFYYNGLCNSGAYTFSSSTVTGSNKDPINWDVTGANKIPDGILNILIGSPATLTTTPKNLTENSSPTRSLMLSPQENALEQAYVRVEYTIHYPPGTIPETHDNIAKVFLPPITWKPGIAYTYTLNIALKALEIAVEEAGWNVWDEVEVIPPINIPDIP
jgi:hypothetical protein